MNTENITVLISSVSKKVPLIKAVRKALEKLGVKGKVVGGDADADCIGKYFVDQFWKMPLLSDLEPSQSCPLGQGNDLSGRGLDPSHPNFEKTPPLREGSPNASPRREDEFISYCQFYGINCVVPTRDGELLYYAQHRHQFAQQGIHVMISDPNPIKICLDKLRFYQTLHGLGFPAIETAQILGELENARYVVKEQFGAGSHSIGFNLTSDEALEHAKRLKHPIFQPYLSGKEMSVDLYVDRTKKAKGVVMRQREIVVHGESQVTTTLHHEEAERLCAKMAEELGLYGHVMFQLIENNGVFYVLECNPRFGGASSLSLEVGLDSFYWFFLEVIDEDLNAYPFERFSQEKRLVRYPEDLIIT